MQHTDGVSLRLQETCENQLYLTSKVGPACKTNLPHCSLLLGAELPKEVPTAERPFGFDEALVDPVDL